MTFASKCLADAFSGDGVGRLKGQSPEEPLFADAGAHLGVGGHCAGRGHAHGYGRVFQLFAQGQREGEHEALAGGVDGLVANGREGRHTADVQDVAPLLAKQVGQQLVGEEYCASHVEVDDMRQISVRGVDEVFGAAHAGVVDEKVDLVLGVDGVGHGLEVPHVGEVEFEADAGCAVVRADLLAHLLDALVGAREDGGDTARGQFEGDGLAQPTARARYEGVAQDIVLADLFIHGSMISCSNASER